MPRKISLKALATYDTAIKCAQTNDALDALQRELNASQYDDGIKNHISLWIFHRRKELETNNGTVRM